MLIEGCTRCSELQKVSRFQTTASCAFLLELLKVISQCYGKLLKTQLGAKTIKYKQHTIRLLFKCCLHLVLCKYSISLFYCGVAQNCGESYTINKNLLCIDSRLPSTLRPLRTQIRLVTDPVSRHTVLIVSVSALFRQTIPYTETVPPAMTVSRSRFLTDALLTCTWRTGLPMRWCSECLQQWVVERIEAGHPLPVGYPSSSLTLFQGVS